MDTGQLMYVGGYLTVAQRKQGLYSCTNGQNRAYASRATISYSRTYTTFYDIRTIGTTCFVTERVVATTYDLRLRYNNGSEQPMYSVYVVD